MGLGFVRSGRIQASLELFELKVYKLILPGFWPTYNFLRGKAVGFS